MKANDVSYVAGLAKQAITKYLGFSRVSSLRYVQFELADTAAKAPRSVTFELSIFVFSMFSPAVVGGVGMFFSSGNTLALRLTQTMKHQLRPCFSVGDFVVTVPKRVAPDSLIYRITVRGNIRKLRNVPKEVA